MNLRWFVLGLVLGLVAGMYVQVAMLAAPANSETTHIHSSSRYDRSWSSLHRQAYRFRGADVVTWTEVQGRRTALRVPGMRVWGPGWTDVAVSWSGYRVRDRGAFRPTRITYVNQRGNRRGLWVAWMVLQRPGERVLVMVAHLPTGVQKAWSGNTARVRQWKAGVAGWGRKVSVLTNRYRPSVTMVVADWNVDVRHRTWRHRIDRHFPGMNTTWRRGMLPRAGTRNRRLIDATWTDARGRARLLRDDASSDHRPYREFLTAR